MTGTVSAVWDETAPVVSWGLDAVTRAGQDQACRGTWGSPGFCSGRPLAHASAWAGGWPEPPRAELLGGTLQTPLPSGGRRVLTPWDHTQKVERDTWGVLERRGEESWGEGCLVEACVLLTRLLPSAVSMVSKFCVSHPPPKPWKAPQSSFFGLGSSCSELTACSHSCCRGTGPRCGKPDCASCATQPAAALSCFQEEVPALPLVSGRPGQFLVDRSPSAHCRARRALGMISSYPVLHVSAVAPDQKCLSGWRCGAVG